MIKVFSDNREIPVNRVEFSDGTLNFKVNDLPSNPRYVSVYVDPSTKGYRVLEEVSLIVDAILLSQEDTVDFTGTEFILELPYLYNARADRRFERGNPVPLDTFLLFIRDHLGVFDKINICDIHNKEAVDKIKGLNIVEKSQLQCFKESLPYNFKNDYDVVCSPDKGAVEKAKTISEHLNVPCVFADKKRDLSTGKLTEMILPDYDFTGKKVLIPDDILDGGNTFISLSEMLVDSGASAVDLYITHMIAAKGLKQFKNSVDKIYVYQTVGDYINKEDIMRFNDGRY